MLNFKTYGAGDETLIILHGLFGSLDNWQGIAQKLSEDFKVYIVDQRNHGKSAHMDEHSYAYMAADLNDFMDQQGINTAHLLGHSMGGKTVMQFAVDFPFRVDRLIVADIAPRYYAPHHQSIIAALKSVNFSEVASRKEVEAVISNQIQEPGVRQFLLKGLTWANKNTLRWKFNLDVISDQIENIGEPLDGHAYFTNPVLFLKGEKSDYISEEDEEQISEYFPQSEVIEISNAGHWLHAENPSDFVKEVLSFLK